jgi:hypothetical protein
MTTSLLRSLIREALLLEEVYGAQAIVYHGTKADPQVLTSALLNDEFVPGRGSGSMYGKGLYTVYDLRGTQTSSGTYGDHVIKLKLNLYGYIIFDPEIALKVYKAPLSIVEQAQEVGVDEDIIEKLKGVNVDRDEFTSVAAEVASKFLKGRVKGIVYTGSRDGRCALVYDPTTAVPISWKNVRDKSWTQVNRESIKPSLRRSASGDWQEEKYEADPFKVLKKLETLPLEERVVNGDLILAGATIASLPEGLQVMGNLDLSRSNITSLPAGLKVGRILLLRGASIKSLPADLKVGGALVLMRSDIESLPAGLKVGGSLDLTYTSIASLPEGLEVGDDLYLSDAHIVTLPAGLKVGGSLYLSDTPITTLPAGLKVGGSLFILRTKIRSLPEDLQVVGRIYAFNMLKVPKHLRGKLVK